MLRKSVNIYREESAILYNKNTTASKEAVVFKINFTILLNN